MTLPQEIQERVARVNRYHQLTKHAFPTPPEPPGLDVRTRPSPYRVFDTAPKVPLSTKLLDVPVDTIHLLTDGLDALPESTVCPPQDLKTLSTWLFMSNGLTQKKDEQQRVTWVRSCPSGGALYPYEIYVAAFAVDGLEPGLYHYCPKEFSLRKLRDGREALAVMKRGRPDLEFLKTVPAALLVSTIFWRSAWMFGKRAYRYALQDAGHLIGNLTVAGTGLGIQTLTRLRLNDSCMRELIGLAPDLEFGQEEAVQAMVVWADKAKNPLVATAPSASSHAPDGDGRVHVDVLEFAPEAATPTPSEGAGFSSDTAVLTTTATTSTSAPATSTTTIPIGLSDAETAKALHPCVLSPIPRAALSRTVVPHASILAAHHDCIDPGVALREVRPPLTELTPLPPNVRVADFPEDEEFIEGSSLRSVLLNRRSPSDFDRGHVEREPFMRIVRLAFRGGSFFPMFPSGPHVALVRPVWLINHVRGMHPGVWYYHPVTDKWTQIGRTAEHRLEAAYLSLEQPICGNAAAVCFMIANLQHLMLHAGPDVYRLAHLEAGIVAQRMALAASAIGLGARGLGGFYDDEVRQFFGLAQSGWEPIYEVAVGHPLDPNEPKPVEEKVDVNDDSIWKD